MVNGGETIDEVRWIGELKPFGNTSHVIVPKLMKDSLGADNGQKVEITLRRVTK